MTVRKKLSLSSENNELAQKKLDSVKTEDFEELKKNSGGTLGNTSLVAGSISDILELEGSYDDLGTFKPTRGQKLKILEPRIKQVFWCRFTDAIEPEFGKDRPVVIISPKNKLGTFSLVLPITSIDPEDDETNSHHLPNNPNPNQEKNSWVITNHIYSVSHWRLRRFWNHEEGKLVTPLIADNIFQIIIQKTFKALPIQKNQPHTD